MTSKPLIMHLCRDLEYRGGVESFLFDFVRYNSAFRHAVVATEGKPGARSAELCSMGISLTYVKGSFLEKLSSVRRHCRDLDVAICHSHFFQTDSLLLMLPAKVRKISGKYAMYAIDSQIGRSFRQCALRTIHNSLTDYFVTCLIGTAIVITDEMHERWRRYPITLHRVTVSTIRTVAQPKPSRVLASRPKLLVATRMVQEKDHQLLLESLPLIPYSELLIFGDGPLRTELEQKFACSGLKGYRFMGSVRRSTLLEYMSKSDIMLLTSATEGLPLLIQEAMSQGLPVVATSVGGNSTLVDDSNGRLVRTRDPVAYATAVNSLIGVDIGAMGNAAIAKCKAILSLDGTIDSINRIYLTQLNHG